MIKKILRYFFIAIVIMMAVRLLLSFELVKTNNRHGMTFQLPVDIKIEISVNTRGMSGDEIIDYSIKQTAKMLSFSRGNDINKGKANCVGYAQLCAAICQYAFYAKNINAYAVPVVGDVKKFGLSLCSLLTNMVPSSWKGFVKDHDFVEVRLLDKTVYVDACFYDYLLNDCKKTVRQSNN